MALNEKRTPTHKETHKDSGATETALGLARVAAAWGRLPKALKAAILAIVDAGTGFSGRLRLEGRILEVK